MLQSLLLLLFRSPQSVRKQLDLIMNIFQSWKTRDENGTRFYDEKSSVALAVATAMSRGRRQTSGKMTVVDIGRARFDFYLHCFCQWTYSNDIEKKTIFLSAKRSTTKWGSVQQWPEKKWRWSQLIISPIHLETVDWSRSSAKEEQSLPVCQRKEHKTTNNSQDAGWNACKGPRRD